LGFFGHLFAFPFYFQPNTKDNEYATGN